MDKKQELMELWKRSFQDSDEFIRFYFLHKYSEENSLVYEENGKPLSAFLMLPYPMSWEGIMLPTSYISGACTLPEARNHGLMSMLLQEGFEEMNKRQIALSTLIPAEDWLFEYYGNMGYAPVFEYSLATYTPHRATSGINTIIPEKYDEAFFTALFPYFERKMQARPCCIQHPLDDYKTITEEIYISGGKIAVAFPPGNDQPSGMAFAFYEEEHIMVREIIYDSPEDKSQLLQSFNRIWPDTEIQYHSLPEGPHTRRYGMARITDAEAMLQHFARQHPGTSFTLKIHDPQLPANNGYFVLENGKCTRPEKAYADLETDIPTLTGALLGFHAGQLPPVLGDVFPPRQPYMNLMID